MKSIKKHLWILPALYVAYEFGDKLFEVLADPTEFANIIFIIIPNMTLSVLLAYAVGFFDFFVAIALIMVPNLQSLKKYSKYIFLWIVVWPLVPSSVRYFGGVAEFEIVQVVAMIVCAIISHWLYKKFN